MPSLADEPWGPRQWLRVRLLTLVFLGFLAYPLVDLLDGHRTPAATALGLAGFTACYARIAWVSMPLPHRLNAPYALVGMLLLAVALVPLLRTVWLHTVAFYASPLLLLQLRRRWWYWAIAGVAASYLCGALAVGTGLAEAVNVLLVVLSIGWLQAAFFGRIQDHIALRSAQAELARLAVAEERLRIARDLHDVLGQELTAMALKAQLSARLVGLDPARAQAEITEVERIARQALDGMRATVSGYRDTSLASEVRTASALLGAVGVRAAAGEVPAGLPPEVETAAAWVVREATTNVVRHARAERCQISVQHLDGGVVVVVRDDGAAAGDGSPPLRHGTGLRGLAERLGALGGELRVAPVDGWFTVRARIPAGSGR